MIFVGVSSSLPPPIWNSENEHGWQVVPLRLGRGDLHRLVLVLDDAELAADHHAEERRPATSTTSARRGRAREHLGVCEPRRRCQAETREHDHGRR